jgi:hypothetical protein
MGYADELWMEQVQLVDAVMRANDSSTVNDLMCRYAVATQKYLSISNDAQMSKHSAVHAVLRFFLEQAGIADEGAVTGVHPVPSVESVANLLNLFPPLKQYCEDMYLNDGVVGALKYGACPVLGHEILLPALKLCSTE